MEVLSVLRGARISAFKARELTREIQGLPASAALDLVAFSTKKAALMVGKTLKSAIANAENNNDLRVDTLVVKEATVGEGPTMKRIKSRARGSASSIRKRTAHIRIVLSDDIVIPTRNKPSGGKKKSKPAARAAAPAMESPATEGTPAAKKNRPKRPKTTEGTPAADETETPVTASTVETSTPATPISQTSDGPGETAAPAKLSSDEDATKD